MDKEESHASFDSSVSIIIPTFNRPKETLEAIKSVLQQTHQAVQIIVVDDGSDEDQFFELRDNISDKRISLLRIPHSGLPGVARQYGVIHSTGYWIAFLDSDDTWEPNKLRDQLEVASRVGASALCSNGFELKNHGKKLKFSHSRSRWISKRQLLSSNQIINSSVLIKKRLLEEVGGVVTSPRVRGCEDYATWLRVSNLDPWYFIDRALVNYREDSPTSIRGFDQCNDSLVHVYALLDFCAYEEKTDAKEHFLLKKLMNKLWIFVLLK
jgi:glycosyltransferase involved in cell wall biosynthesis